jgi:hypothetical protein
MAESWIRITILTVHTTKKCWALYSYIGLVYRFEGKKTLKKFVLTGQIQSIYIYIYIYIHLSELSTTPVSSY